MTERTKYLIPEANYKKFEAQIEKLSRKSVKLIGEEIMPVVFGYEYKPVREGSKEQIKCFNVFLTASTPVLDGWEFVARLDHSNETGTIVRTVPTFVGDMPAKYRENVVKCDHCNINRYRRDTFVVRNIESGEFKQVGSTCLKDFFGHDPFKIAKLAELLGYANETGRASQFWSFEGIGDRRWVELEEYLTYAAQSVLNFGWVSRAVAREYDKLATADDAIHMYHNSEKVTDAARALANDALVWAQTFATKDYLSDYENNVLVCAGAQYIEYRSIGIAASIVGVYFKNQQEKKQASQSNHLGKPADKVTVKATVTGYNARESDFGGYTHIYRFLAGDDVVVWFSSKHIDVNVGDKVTLTGTIKKLDEFRGTKQTVLTRCKVA